MLHESRIPDVIECKDKKGSPVVFDIVFVKQSTGELIRLQNVQCTSSHFEPRTYNVKLENGEFRKVLHRNITEVNNQEIYK